MESGRAVRLDTVTVQKWPLMNVKTVPFEDTGLKRSYREVETCLHEENLQKLLVTVRSSCDGRFQHFGGASTMGPARRIAATIKCSHLEPNRRALCAAEGRTC